MVLGACHALIEKMVHTSQGNYMDELNQLQSDFRRDYADSIQKLISCPCGTAGHCMNCAGIDGYLEDEWKMYRTTLKTSSKN